MSYILLSFAAFFAILILFYYILPKRFQWGVLLFGSIAFYFFSGPKYFLYVLATAVITYAFARLSEKFKGRKASSLCITAAVLLDLGVFLVLKYADFVIENINVFLPKGSELKLFSFILPLGLSFYTFSAVGYIVDISRGKYAAEKNFFKFLLYLIYFPQITEGPIPRFDTLSARLFKEHPLSFSNIKNGYLLVLWGLFKKLVVADGIAFVVSLTIKNATNLSGVELWLGMFAWGIELYGDFSGGIDVSRGVSKMLDIDLDINFKRPYFAINLTDYWNRWHITLGNWVKDYFFYPIALSPRFAKITKFTRKKFGKFVAKTVPVGILSLLLFTIIGIWHGANWGEVLFGVFNGVVILISTILEPVYVKIRKKLGMDEKVGFRIFRVIRTFLVITIARVISLPHNIPVSGKMLLSMFGLRRVTSSFFTLSGTLMGGKSLIVLFPVIAGCIVMFIVSFIEEKGNEIPALLSAKPVILNVLIFSLLTVAIVVFGSYGIGYEAAGFIYSAY